MPIQAFRLSARSIIPFFTLLCIGANHSARVGHVRNDGEKRNITEIENNIFTFFARFSGAEGTREKHKLLYINLAMIFGECLLSPPYK